MTAPTDRPLVLTVRTPEDVLAMVPVLLGFVPEDSVVMLTFGGRRPFHARVDLPRGPDALDDVEEVVAQLLAPVRAQAVRQVLFVLYTADAPVASLAVERLATVFRGAGVEVVEALRTDGRCWWPGLRDRAGVPAGGVPYDVGSHPLTVEAVLAGKAVLGSREQLAHTMAHAPELAAGVVAALAAMSTTAGGRAGRASGAPPRAEVAARVGAGLATYADGAAAPDDATIAWLLRALLDPGAREAAAELMTAGTAAQHAGFWTEVVRRSPETLVAGPAALLAFAAWRAGDGARAWCAVDRCLDADPDHPLGRVVAAALTHALPPDCWPDD